MVIFKGFIKKWSRPFKRGHFSVHSFLLRSLFSIGCDRALDSLVFGRKGL